jgi:hypothetical protein
MRLEGKKTTMDAALNDNVVMELRILHVATLARAGNAGLHIIFQRMGFALIERLLADQTILRPVE